MLINKTDFNFTSSVVKNSFVESMNKKLVTTKDSVINLIA